MKNALIYIYDEFNPEDMAMMQALYSRSQNSVTKHVEKVRTTGSGKFMETYYVNYGHSSIADCGSTTIFIEGVSMFVAKAVEDWPLFSGQESSTRYIDYQYQPVIDPVKSEQSYQIIRDWMQFYLGGQEKVTAHLKIKYPKKTEEKENVYEKAITARTFDILRGFLPAGTTTQFSWHTNLRQAWEKLALLRYHPLDEVKYVAQIILSKLQEKYPHSFSHKFYEETENYRKYFNENYNYFNPNIFSSDFKFNTNIEMTSLYFYLDLIKKRPPKTNLPHFLSELGNTTSKFLLDFGSFRDLQRHRNGVCRMPLLTTKYGFNDWYLNELPNDLKEQALQLIDKQTAAINELNITPEYRQYYIAMGYQVPCQVSYSLPATVYVVELRSGKTVHPTLRKIAHHMHHALKRTFPELVLHSDLEPDDWDIRRGTQDITKK